MSFASIDVSPGATAAVTAGGVAYSWGSNFDGHLGIGTETGPQTCGGSQCSTAPVPVAGGLSFASVSLGRTFTCGVTTAGAAYCWGGNRGGRLGVGTTTGPETCGLRICSTVPVPVAGALSFAEVDAGQGHTCGVTTTGAAYCWGLNNAGQLGVGTAAGPESCLGVDEPLSPCSTVPVPVTGGVSFVAVSAGLFHTCGVIAVGGLYCWGENESGQLGDGTTTPRSTPRRVVQ